MDGKCSLFAYRIQLFLTNATLSARATFSFVELESSHWKKIIWFVCGLLISLRSFYIFDFVKLSRKVRMLDMKDPSLKPKRCSSRLPFVLCQEIYVTLFLTLKLWNIVIGDFKVTEHQIAEKLFLSTALNIKRDVKDIWLLINLPYVFSCLPLRAHAMQRWN